MAGIYIHERKDFPELLSIVEADTGILAFLVEKDYWLMHVLYGLQQQGFDFKLKGGTSLSKGYRIIERFSEDIDIYIRPEQAINETSNTSGNVAKRKAFYDELAGKISIPGIVDVIRDHGFDDERYYRSGGIRLLYKSHTQPVEGIKEGILLEAGFDTVTPDEKLTISSWAYEKASVIKGIQIIDNRAIDVPCYHLGYTFVEKLQTIATKYRREQETKIPNPNFMRQYYDVAALLNTQTVQEFIGTDVYQTHKKNRFPTKDYEIPMAQNEAFLLSDTDIRKEFERRYKNTSALYYKGQPPFDELLQKLAPFLDKL